MAFEGGCVRSRLPDDVLLIIMAKLPAITLARMRIVCKKWNKMLSPTDAIEMIYRNVPIVHYPAFLIQLPWARGGIVGKEYPIDGMQSWVIEPATGQVLKVPMPNFLNMDLALRSWGNVVIDACKSIYCCCRQVTDCDYLTFSLCNPGTNTWRCLPYHNIGGWTFSGMTFDASTTHCTLLIGEIQSDTHITIDIYDSMSNAWSVIDMDMPNSTAPSRGRAVYSKGKFYWMNMNGKGEILQFNMPERAWTKFPQPQRVFFSDLKDLEDLTKNNQLNFERINYSLEFWDGRLALKFQEEEDLLFPPYSWVLTGTDGRVVLVNMVIGCMWELKEDSNEWCQLHIMLGAGLYGVSVNSSGWTLAAGEKKMVVHDPTGRVVRTFEYSKLDPEAPPIPESYDLTDFMWAVEMNNVWWP